MTAQELETGDVVRAHGMFWVLSAWVGDTPRAQLKRRDVEGETMTLITSARECVFLRQATAEELDAFVPEEHCSHELDPAVAESAGADGDGPGIIIDVWCKKCGLSGSLVVEPKDVLWGDEDGQDPRCGTEEAGAQRD